MNASDIVKHHHSNASHSVSGKFAFIFVFQLFDSLSFYALQLHDDDIMRCKTKENSITPTTLRLLRCKKNT